MAKQRIGTYEGLFLFGIASTVDVDASIALAEEMLKKHGAEIMFIRKWDERKLSYEIKKNKRGLYVLAFFKALTASIEKMTRDINLSEKILRVLFTDAAHLSLDEMKAQEPQQPVKEAPRREEFINPVSAI